MLAKYLFRLRRGWWLAQYCALVIFLFSIPFIIGAIWRADGFYAWAGAVAYVIYLSAGLGGVMLYACLFDAHPGSFDSREDYERHIDAHREDPVNWWKVAAGVIVACALWALWSWAGDTIPLLRVGENVMNATALSMLGS